jgi:hypothetical protein
MTAIVSRPRIDFSLRTIAGCHRPGTVLHSRAVSVRANEDTPRGADFTDRLSATLRKPTRWFGEGWGGSQTSLAPGRTRRRRRARRRSIRRALAELLLERG